MKVILVLLLQSPDLPVIADKFQFAAPAAVMSWKSIFDTLNVATVKVLATPTCELPRMHLLVELLPL